MIPMKKNHSIYFYLLLFYLLLMVFFFFLNDNRFINFNISQIDKADRVEILVGNDIVSCSFDENIQDFLSYGGFILKIDNPIKNIFNSYHKKLFKTNIKISYKNSEKVLATAEIFLEDEHDEEYILYMNHVYWTTHSKLEDLLETIQ